MSYCSHGSGSLGCVACAIERQTEQIVEVINRLAGEIQASRRSFWRRLIDFIRRR